MTAIKPMTTNIRTHQPLTIEQQKKRKENTEKAATVVGSTGFAATATKYASKRGLSGDMKQAESTLQTMMKTTTKFAKTSGKAAKQAGGFAAKFKADVAKYAKDVVDFAAKFKNNKFIAPIVKSPVLKHCANGFGVVMAFFVLVTGVSKAAETGNLAFCDMKDKYNQMRSVA